MSKAGDILRIVVYGGIVGTTAVVFAPMTGGLSLLAGGAALLLNPNKTGKNYIDSKEHEMDTLVPYNRNYLNNPLNSTSLYSLPPSPESILAYTAPKRAERILSEQTKAMISSTLIREENQTSREVIRAMSEPLSIIASRHPNPSRIRISHSKGFFGGEYWDAEIY